MGHLVMQSVIFEDRGVQVSYFVENERDDRGMLIRTAVINPLDLKAELDDVFDSLTQLVMAWEGLRRQPPVPSPHT
jgi:hypothetical protein